jgi:predicted outer membrane repeat protein
MLMKRTLSLMIACIVLQVIAQDTVWRSNTATSGGALYMYEFSRPMLHNNTFEDNTGETLDS